MKQTTLLLLAATLLLGLATDSVAQTRRRTSPEQVVSDLYGQHKMQSPFFQRTNRALLDRYFERTIADLIWKDAKGSGDEVGALDGDPLFNAQDMEIKKFAIHTAEYSASSSSSASASARHDKATVTVTFENFGQPHSVYFETKRLGAGWRISDIRYDDGSRLSVILKQ